MLLEARELARGLQLVRPQAPAPVVHRLTPDGRSWLLHAPGWWPAPAHELSELWASRPSKPTYGVIFGRKVAFPRRTRTYGADYTYTGQTQCAEPLSSAPPMLRNVIAQLQAVPMLSAHNAALLNWYDAASGDYMGAHSDDERELLLDAPIVSLSWCTRGHEARPYPCRHHPAHPFSPHSFRPRPQRRFRLVPRKGAADSLTPTWNDPKTPGVLRMRNGCLVVMGGACQQTHKHELMKVTRQLSESVGRRINLTLRAFARSGDRDATSAVEAHATAMRKRPRDPRVH